MTPVGVFFICQNEDKCHFVNSTILSCFEIGKRFPRKAGDQVSPALGKHSSVLYFLLFKVAQHRADIGIEQNGLRFKFFRGNGLAQIDAGVSGFRILGCHA